MLSNPTINEEELRQRSRINKHKVVSGIGLQSIEGSIAMDDIYIGTN